MDEKKKMERWCEITWISNLEERESAHFRPLALIFSFSAPSTCAFAALQLRSSHKSSPTTFGFFLEKGLFFFYFQETFLSLPHILTRCTVYHSFIIIITVWCWKMLREYYAIILMFAVVLCWFIHCFFVELNVWKFCWYDVKENIWAVE